MANETKNVFLEPMRLDEIREKDHKTLDEVTNRGNELIGKKTDEIKKKVDEIREKIVNLQEEKDELLRGKISKRELSDYAKREFQKQKKDIIINKILKPHLSACQGGRLVPFSELSLKINFEDPRHIWMFAVLALNEDNIDEAITLIPDEGMSMEDREAKIKKIDKEISSLSALLGI